MSNIEFVKADIRFNDSFSLLDIQWKLEPGQVWAIMGPSGSGKSALAAAVTGAGEITSGSLDGIVGNAGTVSLESQAALIERERLRDNSDITDEINHGTPVREMLDEVSVDPEMLQRLTGLFILGPLLDRGFRKLSTGETRKVLFTRALCSKPQMLVIDGPFEGLDTDTVPLVSKILRELSDQLPMLLVINRYDEIPAFVSHIALLETGCLRATVETDDRSAMDWLSQLLHLKATSIEIPGAIPDNVPPPLDPTNPLV